MRLITFNAMRRRIPLLKRLIPSAKRRLWRLRQYGGYGLVVSRGATFLVHPQNFVDRQIAFYDDFEKAQIDYLGEIIAGRGCDVFLDVGANLGYYTVLFARRAEVGRMIAFEPDPRNFDQLCANLYLNRLDGAVVVHRAAASAASGTVGFRPGPSASTGQSMVVAETSETQGVPALAIDDVLDASGWTVIAKIDVEGHELAVLEGMTRILAANRCVLQIEIYRDNIARVQDFLAERGFTQLARIEHDFYFVNFPEATARSGSRAPAAA